MRTRRQGTRGRIRFTVLYGPSPHEGHLEFVPDERIQEGLRRLSPDQLNELKQVVQEVLNPLIGVLSSSLSHSDGQATTVEIDLRILKEIAAKLKQSYVT